MPPLLTELPYHSDSALLFEAIADLPWAVFLDSGRHHPAQSRYDILSAQPYMRLVTRGALTEIYDERIELSREDPFALLRERWPSIPRCGGDAAVLRRRDRLFRLRPRAPASSACPRAPRDAERMPEMAIGIYDWAVVVDHLERRSWLVGQGRDPDTHLKWDASGATVQRAAARTRARAVSHRRHRSHPT